LQPETQATLLPGCTQQGRKSRALQLEAARKMLEIVIRFGNFGW
jgi:hypothetical protein